MASAGSANLSTIPASARVAFPGHLLAPLGALVDCLSLVGGSCLAEFAYSGPDYVNTPDVAQGLVASLAAIPLHKLYGHYRLQALAFPWKLMPQVLRVTLAGLLVDIALLFLHRDLEHRSRGVWILFVLFALTLAVLARLSFAWFVRSAAKTGTLRGRRVVLIGEIEEMSWLTRDELMRFGITEVARFALASNSSVGGLSPNDLRQIERALTVARGLGASEFALFLRWSRDRTLSEIGTHLRSSPMSVRLYPDRQTRNILNLKRERHFDPYISVEVQSQPLRFGERLVKRAFDITIAATGVLCLSPLLAVVALLIKFERQGPVIFKQTRRGFDNRQFRIWKFRSMTVLEDGAKIVQACKDDDRVTPLGRILRRSSIDELPQLFNVLMGDMSIVGPRPHAVAHDEEYGALIRDYAFRHHVKPGLTGAAQVMGLRGQTQTVAQMEARVKLDLWYVNNWSIWLDLKIVLHTFGAMLAHEAY